MINASNGLFGKSKNKQYDCKPGFNEYVKDLHDTARKRFVAWREAKKPRDHNNPFFKEMTTSRARFKLALRFINPRARRSGPLDPQAWKICHSIFFGGKFEFGSKMPMFTNLSEKKVKNHWSL